jgi:hypothetical protein
VFRKTVSGSKHFLRKPEAIAFDIESVKAAEAAGASLVVVQDRDTGKTYTASIDQIWKSGLYLDRGFGQQVALPLTYWTVH